MRYLTETKKCSERRACRLVCLPRQTARYLARKREGEAALVERLPEIGAKHGRFGYRRAHALVRREGQKVNHKRVHRLWKREGLSVKRRIKKKRLVGPKQERPTSALHPNHVWTVDFVQDQTITGRKLRMLTVTDEFIRESLGIEVGLSLTAEKVVAVRSWQCWLRSSLNEAHQGICGATTGLSSSRLLCGVFCTEVV